MDLLHLSTQGYVLIAVGVLALVTVLAIVLSIPITDVVWKYAPYAYPLPKAKALEAETLEVEEFEELREASLRDLATRLEELGIEPDRVRPVMRGNTEPVEVAIKRRAVEAVMDRLAESGPEDVEAMVKALMARYELEDLKAVIRALHAGEEPGELVDRPVLLEEDTWREVRDAKSVQEVLERLRGTPYDRGLEDALREYEETGSLLPVELALDRAYYEYLWDLATGEEVGEELARLLGLEIDLYNVEVALRGALMGLDPDTVLRAMADGGWELAEWRKRELAEAEDPSEVVEQVSGTSFGRYLRDALEEYSESGSADVLDRAVRRARYETVLDFVQSDIVGAPAIVQSVYAKQREVDNLIALVNAKVADVGFAPV